MATFYKRGNRWHALIRRKGFPVMDKTFDNKKGAEYWARRIEGKLDCGIVEDYGAAARVTMDELFERYRAATAGIKRNAVHERYALKILSREFGHLKLATLSRAKISAFRDSRLALGLSPSTVRNNLHLLSAVVRTAINDWGYELPYNPVHRVTKPAVNNARDRRLEAGEEQRLLEAARTGKKPAMEHLIVLAIETGMRLGEMLSLTWDDVDYGKREAFLAMTKNGQARRVPLSKLAISALQALPRQEGSHQVFPDWKASTSFQHAWGRLLKRASIRNLRFHDLRHEAASRFSERGMDVLRISAITGHRSLQMLRRYTHFRTADLADELDRPLPNAAMRGYGA